MNIKLENLFLKGWIEIQNITSDSDLINLAHKVGNIIPHPNGDLIFRLIPQSGEKSIKGTFSNRYGFGNFPLHTDTAFWPKPAHYLILYSVEYSNCNTSLISFEEMLKELIFNDYGFVERAIFKVETIHSQFYTSLFFREDSIWGIKYDQSCMKPVNDSAKEFVKMIYEVKPKVTEINWKGTNAVIIDNWKMLHGRNSVNQLENRVLKRIYIN